MLYIILYVIAAILVISSILSIFRNTDNRYLKALDFPRIQYFIIALGCMAIFGFIVRKWKTYDYLLLGGLLGVLVINGTYLIKYTGLVSVDVPPARFEDLPDNEGQHEIAMKKLGRDIVGQKLPTLVAGDLNDVVWSNVDKLTGTKDILYDVRVGRGFYNSFNAANILMRWPLDHVFVTKEFRLLNLQRLSKIGSNHFPIFVELAL